MAWDEIDTVIDGRAATVHFHSEDCGVGLASGNPRSLSSIEPVADRVAFIDKGEEADPIDFDGDPGLRDAEVRAFEEMKAGRDDERI